ncbi:MAG: primase-helicase family protein, partial [Pseudomonadota bacterium]
FCMRRSTSLYFNADSASTLFVCLDEVYAFKGHKLNNQFKSLITESTRVIEPKGRDRYTIEDYRCFVATTNNPDAFKIDPGDRRFYSIEVSDEWSTKAVLDGRKTHEERDAYFSHLLGNRSGEARMATSDETREVARHFYWYLMRRDIRAYNPRTIVASEFREDQLEINRDPIELFLEAWTSNELTHLCPDLQDLTSASGAASSNMQGSSVWTLFGAFVKDSHIYYSGTRHAFFRTLAAGHRRGQYTALKYVKYEKRRGAAKGHYQLVL